MQNFRPPRLMQLIFLRRYRRMSVRRLPYVFEERFSNFLNNAPVQVVNAPTNAPPDMPQFTIVDGKRQLQVSDLLCALTMNFDTQLEQLASIPKLLSKPARGFDEAIESIWEGEKDYYTGITSLVNVPFAGNSLLELAKEISDIVSMPKPPGKPAASQQVISWREGDFYYNADISMYQKFDVIDPSRQAAFIDVDFTEPNEIGIQLKFEVNTRGLIGTVRKYEAQSLVDHIERSIPIGLKLLTNDRLSL